MPQCLITGASGFVGSNLAAYLAEQGWGVHCLVRHSSNTRLLRRIGSEAVLGASRTASPVELVTGTLDDEAILAQAAAKIDVVFHLAGRLVALGPKEFTHDNVRGTRHVARACARQANPPVLVYVSSIAAGGPATDQKPKTENDASQPVSNYGRSKLAAEKSAARFADRIPVSIVRPPIIFGPADRASLQIFIGVRRLHLHPVPGRGPFPVSVVHVTDLCNALYRVAQQGCRVETSEGMPKRASGTYYVTAERTIQYAELGTLAAAALGTRTLTPRIPKGALWLAGAFWDMGSRLIRKPGYLNLDKIREATAPGWVCSDEKIRQQLGYQPAATLERRFAETAQWYRREGWL